MKKLQRFNILSSIALVAGMSVAGTGHAIAAQSQPLQVTVVTVPVVAADYFWNGRHYVYRWHGRYFNHRRWHNNEWAYY